MASGIDATFAGGVADRRRGGAGRDLLHHAGTRLRNPRTSTGSTRSCSSSPPRARRRHDSFLRRLSPRQRVQLYAAAHERRRTEATEGLAPRVLSLRDLLRELDVRMVAGEAGLNQCPARSAPGR